MATIEKRIDKNGSISYRAKVRLKGHRQESATFSRLTDAKRWITQTEAAIREGRYFKSSESKRKTLAETIQRYRKERLNQLKDGHRRGRQLDWWESNAGFLILADITPSKIAELRDTLKATPTKKGLKRSDATINRYLAALSPVFSFAIKEWGWMDANPVEKISKGKEARGRTRFLSKDERDRLLSACDDASHTPELKTIVLIAITTGARRNEIANLRWSDVDITRGRLVFNDTKNGDTRAVPLVGPAKSALMQWGKIRPIMSTSMVFPGRESTTKDKALDFERAWRTAIKRAQLDDFRFHDLRHTAASYLAMNGAGIREIADILGHKTLAMVQRYSHLCDDHKTVTIERMAKAIFEEQV